MELHFVHYASYHDSMFDAFYEGKPESFAVLGVFFTLTKKHNPNLQPIVSQLRNILVPRESKHFIKKSVNLYWLIPRNLKFFTYKGSFTYPPCAEVVLWNVFETPIPISERQLKAFRRLKTYKGESMADNFRSEQRLGDRPLVLYQNVRVSGADCNDKFNCWGYGKRPIL